MIPVVEFLSSSHNAIYLETSYSMTSQVLHCRACRMVWALSAVKDWTRPQTVVAKYDKRVRQIKNRTLLQETDYCTLLNHGTTNKSPPGSHYVNTWTPMPADRNKNEG